MHLLASAVFDPTWNSFEKRKSIGTLSAGVQARIVLDNGSDAPTGELGEIWVRGPMIMKYVMFSPFATAPSG